MEGSCPLFEGRKGEDIKLEDAQCDNGNMSRLFYNNNSKSEGEDDFGGKDEDNNSGQSKDDAGRNSEILNIKSKIEDSNETSNLGEIAVGKLAFYCITNLLVNIPTRSTVALDNLTLPLLLPVAPFISGFSVLSSVALGFPALSCPVLGLFVHFVPGLPSLP